MATEFLLPDIGEGLTEATVVEWLASVGEELTLDGPMVEMETDKAVTEIPAPVAGVLLYQGAAEGESLDVGQVLAVIGAAGETWEPSTPVATEAAAPIVGTLEEPPATAGQALPAVRKLAAELGVDLGAVVGSGPGGRITAVDVEAATGGSAERVALSATRRAIADNLTRSWREIPHVTTFGEADAASLLAARQESGQPLEAHLIAAITPLLGEFGDFNASFVGDAVLRRTNYDLGFAVDTPEGLMVAVVRGADAMTIAELGQEVTRLAGAAKERSASVGELRGQTFTISNIGAVGGRYGTPIVPYGTTAILSIGRADPAPGVVDGELAVVQRFPLSLSYDHRVIDGAKGRAFLGAVIAAIEA
ncbi:MAG: 2-oxo acid dehydrogenase subunit E2 [Acidimicrobiia bacterium]|nr:2-oxo acid dehydrogenase subunit E2 [Acidimicrobiia bacterium]